ncbi:sister chromatid cohesion 1 protein 1 [Lathyrus oleraceus]|uniref:Sister chromatid cohesion 1 protein 1 n=2 Tax=Pisum sativum TaxID=3888 RepID=A0A9D4YAP2_PEA|nr:sister chromatid cohesion 1 protein 1 [Pisum sativum]KAI5434035.1 hypothetical protein KIW84_021049 [Pisum sativum]
MFYSHQLLARKAPLGQIWMAATMHAKINRKKLNMLNIAKICEEILYPAIPMALRLSGILMGGVVIVYERKVKLLYDDVSRLLVEINEAWKVKNVPDSTMLRKGKSKAKKVTITNGDEEQMTREEIEPSRMSNAAPTMGFQHTSYFSMRLDSLDEPNIGREEEDPMIHLHQAAPENITLIDSFQTYVEPHNRFERFDIEGDDETQLNAEFPSVLIPSPPTPDDPKRDDIIEDKHPEPPIIQQDNEYNENMNAREEPQRRGPNKRKRGKPIEMDEEQTTIPAPRYQNWLQNTSDLLSKRGGMKKLQQRHGIMSSTKIADIMEVPLVALNEGLFSSVKKDIYYPTPLLDLWIKATQPPHDSPSVRVTSHHPPEPSSTSPPGVHNNDFAGYGFEEFDGNLDNLFNATAEKVRTQILENGLRVPESTLHASSRKSDGFPGGDSARSIPSTASEHGYSSQSDLERGRFRKRVHSLSGNSSRGLPTVAENENLKAANFKLPRLSDIGATPDQELLVETGPTQTQGNTNLPSDKITESIHAQLKAHFSTRGVPESESLEVLAAGMTKKSAAQLFYQTCVLVTRDVLRVEQKEPYGPILISKGSQI